MTEQHSLVVRRHSYSHFGREVVLSEGVRMFDLLMQSAVDGKATNESDRYRIQFPRLPTIIGLTTTRSERDSEPSDSVVCRIQALISNCCWSRGLGESRAVEGCRVGGVAHHMEAAILTGIMLSA